MLTPFGNPQNLYLYTKFNIPNGEFIRIMLPPFALAVIIITACCLFVKKEPLKLPDEKVKMSRWRVAVYMVLFALSILIVFRGIPYFIGLIVIPLALILLDRKALKDVDWALLFTFVFFFIFSGNMARIESVRNIFSFLLSKNTLIFSIPLLSAYQQRPLGYTSFTVYGELSLPSRGSKYRRSGNAYRVPCKSHNL